MTRQRALRSRTSRPTLFAGPAVCAVLAVACVGTSHGSSASTTTGAGSAAPSTTKAATTTGTSVPTTATTVPPPRIFPRSLFTRGDVASWPTTQKSSLYVSDVVADYRADYGSVGVNTMPIFTVGPGQTKVALSASPGCNNFLASTSGRFPAPPHVPLNGSSDNPLVVYQPATGRDWELWQARLLPNGSYQACWGGMLNVKRSSGVFPVPYGLSATGISYLATAITDADVASGHINHALALELPRCDGHVFPADRSDCGEDAGQPPEGTWFRLPARLPVPRGLSPFARMVFVALQHYGAVVTDQAGAVMVQAEQNTDWAAEGHPGVSPIEASWAGLPEFSVIADIPWQDMQVVSPPHHG